MTTTQAPEVVTAVIPPPSAIDFKTLSDELGFIKATPAWDEVRRAIDRLMTATKRGRSYGGYPRDVGYVKQYAALLNRLSQNIGLAIFCGNVVGRVTKGASPASRLHDGLRAIAAAYQVQTLDEALVLGQLQILANELCQRFQPLRGTELNLPPVTDQQSFDDWATTVDGMLDGVRELNPTENELQKVQVDAWSSLRFRLSDYLGRRGSQPQMPAYANVDEILMFAAGRRPNDLVGFDLSKLALGSWSAAFMNGVRDTAPTSPEFCPFWLAVAALRALGFAVPPGLVQDAAERWAYGNRPFEDLHYFSANEPWPNFLEPAQPPPLAASVVIKRSPGSIVDRWLPDPRFAVLPLTADEFETLHVLGAKLSFLQLNNLIFEMPANEGVEKRVTELAQRLEFPPTFIYRLHRERKLDAGPQDIVRPNSVADLFPAQRAATR